MIFKIGVIRVVSIDDKSLLALHGRLLEDYFPEFETISRCIKDQYMGIHDDHTYRTALPKIAALGGKMSGEVEGIIVSCAADPGVEKLQEKLSIPVIGAGRSSALYSLSIGKNIGVIGIGQTRLDNIIEVLGDNLSRYIIVQDVKNTNDLKTERGREAIITAARELKMGGSEVILLACTGMSTVNMVKYLKKEIDIPVIDPVFAAGLFIYGHCLRQHKNNMR